MHSFHIWHKSSFASEGCVACNYLWPWPIFSRSFSLDLENHVRSVVSTVQDGFFPYLVQMISRMRWCVACDDLDLCLQGHSTLFWLRIQYELVNSMGNRSGWGVFSERRCSSCSGCFWSILPFCQHLDFPGKPLKLISANHTWLTYGCRNILWHPSVTLGQRHQATKQDRFYLFPIYWEPLINRYKTLFMLSIWSNFGGIQSFKYSICHFLEIIGPIDVKLKANIL